MMAARSLPRRLAQSFLAVVARLQPRRISAMLRARNEEEFLAAAVGSIVDTVDEIVLIDNLSEDRTPQIMAQLATAHPRKITVASYPHAIARVGAESRRLSESVRGRSSPQLSSNYYEWCRRRLRHPFALKWDGDMIALPEFDRVVRRWRAGRALGLVFGGANLHPDRLHSAASRSRDRASLAARLRTDGLPRWVTALDRDWAEPRLFPRRFARYTPRIGWTQTLDGPFRGAPSASGIWRHEEPPLYLHLKFWKHRPLLNYTDELAEVIADNLAPGDPMPEAWRRTLERHGVCAPEIS